MLRVEGADELRRALRRAQVDLTSQLKIVHKDAAEIVVQAALPRIPVRSGRLRGSVRSLGSARGGRIRAGTAGVDYAAAIHWGRRVGNVWGGRMAPNPIRGRPFLWDAAEAVRGRVVDEYKRAVDRLLERALR